MNKLNALKSLLVTILLISTPTLVQAARGSDKDYEEVTYDELLNELSTKKNKLVNDHVSPFDTVMIHAGLGYISSFANYRANNQNLNRYQNGLQLSLGIDLFSPNWYSEGVFRNYGVTSQGEESINLKEFDLKVGYKAPIAQMWSYSLASGLSNRFLTITDSSKSIDVNTTTPSLLLSAGVYINPNKNLALGLEGSAHSALVNRTVDRDSVDFAFRIITSL